MLSLRSHLKKPSPMSFPLTIRGNDEEVFLRQVLALFALQVLQRRFFGGGDLEILCQSDQIKNLHHVGGKARDAEGLLPLFGQKRKGDHDADARAVHKGFRLEFEEKFLRALGGDFTVGALEGFLGRVSNVSCYFEDAGVTTDAG